LLSVRCRPYHNKKFQYFSFYLRKFSDQLGCPGGNCPAHRVFQPSVNGSHSCRITVQNMHIKDLVTNHFVILNPLNPELNPMCWLLALLGAHHFLHVSRIRVKSLTLRLLMLYIYGAPILDVSRSHTTTQHSR